MSIGFSLVDALSTLSHFEEEKASNDGVIPTPSPRLEAPKENDQIGNKKWNIRPRGDPDYPITSCGHTCYDCRKAHYMYVHENALNVEYKRLLKNEKDAMSSTIEAVEGMENEHAAAVSELILCLDIEKQKTSKLMAELEHERKLRLSEVYTRQTSSHESDAIAAGIIIFP